MVTEIVMWAKEIACLTAFLVVLAALAVLFSN